MSWRAVIMLLVLVPWFVWPTLAFLTTAAIHGLWKPFFAILALFGAMGVGAAIGVFFARWRRCDPFEGALNGVCVGLLVGAPMIAIHILR